MKHFYTKSAVAGLVCSLLAPSSSGPAIAQAGEVYKGETLKIVAGTGSGSAAGLHGRLIQQHIGKYIPGNPTVIVQYMPSGGGVAAANHIFNVANRDGTEIGLLNRNTLFFPLFGMKQAQYRPEKFEWIGTPASYTDNAWIFVISANRKQKTVTELVSSGAVLNVGGVGPSNPFVSIIQNLFGVKMQFITGYKGAEMMLAFERGEVDAFGAGYDTLPRVSGGRLSSDEINFLVQFRQGGRLSKLKDVPNGRELAKSEDDKALIDLAASSLTLGFPLAGPPGIPKESSAALRTAFKKLVDSDEYKSQGKKMGLEYSPMGGEELQKALRQLAESPPALIARYKKLLGR